MTEMAKNETEMFTDWQLCEYCGNEKELGDFVCVKISNGKEIRFDYMCKSCLKKGKANKDYSKYITEKAFSENLGRKLK